MVKKIPNNHHKFDEKQSASDRSSIKEKIEQNWAKAMHSTHKNMSKGAENIARIVKSRTHWGNKQLWGNAKKEK